MADPSGPSDPPVLPDVVTTQRLRLAVFTAAEVADVRSGVRREGWHADFPREDDRDGVGMWREGDTWASRTVVRDGVTVGSMGFFGPPEPTADGGWETEVGYGLVEAARGQGLATEALAGLLEQTDAVGVGIRATFESENRASLRVLVKCGFTELRGSDEEGHLVMARPPRP